MREMHLRGLCRLAQPGDRDEEVPEGGRAGAQGGGARRGQVAARLGASGLPPGPQSQGGVGWLRGSVRWRNGATA